MNFISKLAALFLSALWWVFLLIVLILVMLYQIFLSRRADEREWRELCRWESNE